MATDRTQAAPERDGVGVSQGALALVAAVLLGIAAVLTAWSAYRESLTSDLVLKNYSEQQATIALPSVNGARPVVHLTVDIESLLEDSQNAAAAWLERFGVPTHVISAAKAKLLACDATLEPMIMRDGQLVATLPSIQTVPAHLRKAVLLRDKACRINSCDAPIAEIHHLIYLSQGGPTTMANLAGLCWFHHHMIHNKHWTLTGDANHELTLTNTATGQQWTNRPPRKRE